MLELPDFHGVRILVVGDLMLDRYWHGGASRISPEAPVPIVNVADVNERAGGAGNVALNLRSLGAEVVLLGVIGTDEAAAILQSRISDAGIIGHFQHEPHLPTITKLRVISQNQQLIRLDFEHDISQINKNYLENQYDTLLPTVDLVVLSDYNKGTLSNSQLLINKAKKLNKPVLVDPKGHSFNQYHGATMLTPNLKELEQIVKPCTSEQQLVERGLNLVDELDLSALLVTRGSKGMLLLRPDQAPVNLPARAREVYDVTGAGDTVIAVLAATIAAGHTFDNGALLANTAASVVVGRVGAVSVTLDELHRALHKAIGNVTGVLSLAQLKLVINEAKANNEIIVATTGIFELVDFDQIKALQQAKAQGQRLVVMVHANAVTKSTSEFTRRLEIIAALGCVDWVVPVTRSQIPSLIAQIKPEIVVTLDSEVV